MEDIVVVDNFLSEQELTNVASLATYKNEDWALQKSWDDKDKHPLKEMDFNGTFLVKKLNDNEYYTSYLFNKIKNHFNYNYKLVDVYLNGHEPLRDGSFHIDGDADRTVILYVTPWIPSFGGFTHFMKSEKEHSVIVPLWGRMINFNSNIPHKAYSFSNQNCPMRITAAFKLKL